MRGVMSAAGVVVLMVILSITAGCKKPQPPKPAPQPQPVQPAQQVVQPVRRVSEIPYDTPNYIQEAYAFIQSDDPKKRIEGAWRIYENPGVSEFAIPKLVTLLGEDQKITFQGTPPANDDGTPNGEGTVMTAWSGYYAGLALRKMGKATEESVIEALKSNSPAVRYNAAAWAVPSAVKDKYIPTLLQMTRSDDPLVRRHGLLGLTCQDRTDEIVERITEMLKSDAEPGVRNEAASALAGVAKGEAIPILLECMDSDDVALRAACVHGVAALKPGQGREIVAKGLEDREAVVLSEAALTAGRQHFKEFADRIRKLAVQPNTRHGAVLALVELEDKNSVREIGNALRTDEFTPGEKAIILAALGGMGADAVPYLTTALRDDNADLRANAAIALAKLGDQRPQSQKALIGLLDDPEESVRKAVSGALISMGDDIVQPVIMGMRSLSDEGKVRAAAVLKGITKQDIGPDQKAWWNWYEDNMKRKR